MLQPLLSDSQFAFGVKCILRLAQQSNPLVIPKNQKFIGTAYQENVVLMVTLKGLNPFILR
jgi:hypothetical protein